MKSTAKHIAVFLISMITMLALLCSCGSELDGTWTSNSDAKTKIKFSGTKVKVSYGSFHLSGTYEVDEEDENLLTLNLTDESGNKYRITAKKKFGEKGSAYKKKSDTASDAASEDSGRSYSYGKEDKNILILENPINGQQEVFKK